MVEPLRPGLERFPRKFEFDELPYPVGDAISRVEDESAIALMLIMPPQEYALPRFRWLRSLPFGWRVTPLRWLIFGACQVTVIQAAPDGAYQTIVIPFAEILEIQLVSVLLYAYVEFAWRKGGRVDRLRVEFNFVGERWVQTGIDHIRSVLRVGWRRDGAAINATDPVSGLPLKFRNFLRSSLLPDEPVEIAVFQPAIRQQERRLRRYLSPNRAIALTDHSLIVIEEDNPRSRQDYKMVQRYYPLAQLHAATLETGRDPVWLRLWFGSAACGEAVQLPLEAAAVRSLRDAFRPWMAAPSRLMPVLPDPW